ncbi:MAG: hypothetical protein LBQ19_05385 [Synergistaceae bacterium]|nr:hypothetical protein [Synergistaceae bacterium]
MRTELSLWKNAGIMNPEGNRQYVESSRDDVTALFQAGEEKAFVLIGEASFAQYSNTMQTPELEKIAGTGEYKSCFLCVVKGSAFKRARAEAAEGFAVWFSGNEAREIIRSFDIGGLKPFRPVPPLK